MHKELGVGLIVGAVTGSSIYIWNSEHFTKSQKTFLLICIIFPPAQWVLAILMYLFNKSSSSEKTNFSKPSANTSKQSQNKQSLFSTNEQKQSLKILKDKGILTASEYQEKIDIINEQTIIEKVHKSSEYHNLKNVFQSNLFTKEQFDEKTNKLIADYKEYFSIFGENIYPEFTWELYKSLKLNIKINVYDYSNTYIYGKWKFKNGQIFLYHDKETGKDKLKVIWTNGMNRYGEWELNKFQLNVKLYGNYKSENTVFQIEELGSHVFVYFMNDKKYTTIKDLSEEKNVW